MPHLLLRQYERARTSTGQFATPEPEIVPDRVTKGDIAGRHRAQIKLESRTLSADFGSYFRAAWEVMEPGTPLEWSWHYEYICEWITYASSGQLKERPS